MAKKRNNKKLLFDLLQINSPSYEEEKVAELVMDELDKLGFTYEQDTIGNIYAQRGIAESYPLLNAHMDIVELWDYKYYKPTTKSSYPSVYDDNASYYDKEWSKEYVDYGYSEIDYLVGELGTELLASVVSCKDCSVCKYCYGTSDIGELCSEFEPTFDGERKIIEWAEKYGLLDEYYSAGYGGTNSKKDKRYLISEMNGKITGKGEYRVLGGDDKCGIFIALEVARKTTIPMKLLFTVAEEIGCVGIDHFIAKYKKWFRDVKYSITIDRKGGDNLLLSQLGVTSCTKGFGAKVAMAGILEDIPVKVMDGSISDVVSIREIVKDSINISAGYHNPHDEDEYIIWSEVVKIIAWVKRIVTDNSI